MESMNIISTRRMWSLSLCAWALGQAGILVADGAVRVEVVRANGHGELRRGGQPYFIKGAGGDASRDALVAAGGNSIRTWGSDHAGRDLNEAQSRGLTVTVGIWLGHERHGFNYADPAALAGQEELVRKTVTAHRAHPALLIWALGNEMELDCTHEEVLWPHVNRLAKICKELDPDHPTMTVVAELSDAKVRTIERLCPDIDIVGINSYGGAGSAVERYRKAGGTKPCIVTEFGPPGHWETGKTAAGVPKEMTSTQKAERYLEVYRQGIAAPKEFCLGSYVFVWGSKVEATPTWYGLFLKDGSRLGAVEAMTAAWGGPQPTNRCPTISEIKVPGEVGIKAGDRFEASVEASDADHDTLTFTWAVIAEGGGTSVGGDAEAEPAEFPEAVVAGQGTPHATVSLPGGGVFRLYAYVRDGHGNAAYANVPLKAEGPAATVLVAPVKLPFIVYGDGAPGRYSASGYMGASESIRMDAQCVEKPKAGDTCLQVDFAAPGGWGGVLWQSPPNDWGKLPGGFNLTGASMLEFWARGAEGGEKVSFQVGGLGKDKPYYDTDTAELKDVVLKRDWTRYRIPLDGRDLSRIKTGFGWALVGQGKPLRFYLDEIRYTAD